MFVGKLRYVIDDINIVFQRSFVNKYINHTKCDHLGYIEHGFNIVRPKVNSRNSRKVVFTSNCTYAYLNGVNIYALSKSLFKN